MAYVAADGKFGRKAALLFIIAAVCLFPLLRFLQTGHLLTWDEAMNICSVRALASLGSDDFSNWFWRHPPLYSLLTMLLLPLREAFPARIEIMNIALGMINLGLLFAVNRRLFGILTASLSVFILAVMPGSIFFDLWIKRDHLAVLFGLLSILLILNRRYAFSALCAGLGFLSKETFLFLYIPVAAMSLYSNSDKPSRPLRFLMITVIPFLTAVWWFFLSSRSGLFSSISQHLNFAVSKGPGWSGDFTFYPALIYKLLSPAGAILLIAGLICIAKRAPWERRTAVIWPALPLVATILLLTLIPRKVPWIVIVLLPCMATAQAIAVSILLKHAEKSSKTAIAVVPLSLLLIITLSIPAFRHSHEEMLKLVSPDQYRGSTRSRDTATAANALINDKDRVLLSSFHYWKGIEPGQMCPVFTCYFKPRAQILAVPHNTPFEQIVSLLTTHNLGWAIVSPEPGEDEKDIIGGFIEDAGLAPVNLGYTCIFDCRPLLAEVIPLTVDNEVAEPLE